MRTVTTMIEDEVYETVNENGNRISIDMREKGLKSSHSPMEMVLAAVSGCVAVDLVEILKKRRKTVLDLKIETSGQRRDDHPRGFTHIHSKYILTSPDAKEEEFRKAADLALNKYCSVASSLKADIQFSVEIIRPQEVPA